MKLLKVLTVPALSLALLGGGVGNIAHAEENASVEQNIPVVVKQDLTLNEVSIDANHEIWTGNDTWMYVRTLLLSWSNSFSGETSTTFNHYEPKMSLRYHVANTGSTTFTWKITAPNGSKWSGGTLSAGQSVTATAYWDIDYMPKGKYVLSIVTSNGGKGSAKAAVRSI